MFGHIAFSGSGIKGDILANFDNGLMAQMTRIGERGEGRGKNTFHFRFLLLGFVLSVVVSFPFMVNPCRSTVYSFLYGKVNPFFPFFYNLLLFL